jgi:hypothetical protein
LRALILLLSAIVVGLAASILLADTTPEDRGPVFYPSRGISDALPGEHARYRDESGLLLTWSVPAVVPSGADRPPHVQIQQKLQDRTGRELPEGSGLYEHRPTRHGFVPLMAPSDPRGFDRVWIWDRIRRERITWKGREREVWRIDFIDPALPAEAGVDHVVVWMDEAAPVFGILRWQRAGRTWELIDGNPMP